MLTNAMYIYRVNLIWIVVVFFLAVVTGIAIANAKWIYLGLVFIPFLVYLCIEKPFIFPFGAYVFLIPFDSVLSVAGGNTEGATITKFLGVMTIFVLFLKGLFDGKLKKPNSATIWLSLFIAYSLLTIFWAIQPKIIAGLFPTALGLLLLYLTVASYQIKENEFEELKYCILAGGFAAALYIIYSYMNGSFHPNSQRASMMIGDRVADPNYFVLTLIIPVSVCIHHMVRIKNKINLRVLYGIILCVILFSIIVTGSRGGLLGTLSVAFVYILFTKGRIKLAAIFIISGLALIQFVPEVFFERIHDAVETKGIGRTHLLFVGLKAFGKYWLFGAGLNNFIKAFTEFSMYDTNFQGFDRGAHNIFLGVLVELGVIGGTLFITMIIKHYRTLTTRFRQNYCDDQIMLKAAFLGILITSFFLDSMFRKAFWLLFMMIMMHRSTYERET